MSCHSLSSALSYSTDSGAPPKRPLAQSFRQGTSAFALLCSVPAFLGNSLGGGLNNHPQTFNAPIPQQDIWFMPLSYSCLEISASKSGSGAPQFTALRCALLVLVVGSING